MIQDLKHIGTQRIDSNYLGKLLGKIMAHLWKNILKSGYIYHIDPIQEGLLAK